MARKPMMAGNWKMNNTVGEAVVLTQEISNQYEKEWPESVDIVICPPGVKHWHGAKPNQAMQHIAIGERAENEQVQWLEEVSDEIYLQPIQATSIK